MTAVSCRSVQGIPEIPPDLRLLYKTAWEIKQRALIDMAADRGAFIDQSQSLNLFVESPDTGRLTSMHFYAWQVCVHVCVHTCAPLCGALLYACARVWMRVHMIACGRAHLDAIHTHEYLCLHV